MAITAMGLGTKAAPDGANLDPQAQFWSFLSAFCGKQVTTTTGSDEWQSSAWFSGFRARANDPTDMSVLIGGENGTIDSAVLWNAGQVVLLSTDGEAQKVTIPTAPSAGARYDAIVSYIDKSSADAATEKPGTPDYIKTIVVSGTAAQSPSKPTSSQIKAKLPAGVSNYFRWCNVYVESGATGINDSNIEDERPASPNVYYAPHLYTLNGGSPKPWHETVYATTTVPAGLYLLTLNVRISTGGSGSYGQWAFLRKGSTTSGSEILRAGAWGHFDQVFTANAIVQLDGGNYALTGQADDNSQATLSGLKAYMLKIG